MEHYAQTIGRCSDSALMRPATIEGVMAKAKALILETPIDNDDDDGHALDIGLRLLGRRSRPSRSV